jgi:sugar (pentulose or hexulose) kinase
LTGWIGTDYSNAALYGLFFDFRERRWLPEILTFIGLSGSKLPDPVPCHKIVGKINREAALATGLLQGTPVIAGTVDGCASMLAAGVFRPGQSAISLGTSSDWGIECQGDQFVPRTISIPSAASSINQHLVITTIPTAGGFLKWFRDILSMFDEDAISYSSLDIEAENSLPGANGLLAIPHITGQATPFWDPQPHGGFIGLTVAHKRGDLVRAIMESIAYALKENQEWLIAHRFQIGENVGLIGGGASSQLWCQIICDVLGVVGWKNSFSAEPSIGAAILAGIGIGLIPDINAAIAWSESAKSEKFEPDPKHRQLYDELFNCYREFSGSTKNLAHQLSEFSKCLMGSE